jgi:hypothetical protein
MAVNMIDVQGDVLIPHQSQLRIVTATEADVSYVVDRAYRHRKRVGWLPSSAIESAIRRGWVWQCWIDGQRAGHTLITGGDRVPHVLRHNCVERDLWSRGLGTAWTSAYLAYSLLTSRHAVARVRTRQDITEQSVINAKTGARPIAVDDARKWSGGHGVVTWVWRLRQRPSMMPRVGVNHIVTEVDVDPWMRASKAHPDPVAN